MSTFTFWMLAPTQWLVQGAILVACFDFLSIEVWIVQFNAQQGYEILDAIYHNKIPKLCRVSDQTTSYEFFRNSHPLDLYDYVTGKYQLI